MPGPFGAKEEIKMKLDMLALISEYVPVKKSGASWMAICPFHNEKSPSLHVSPEKGVWYCHGCGEGGDIFGFVMRLEGMDFPEAMRHLGKKAGVTISEFESKESAERRSILKINTVVAKWYREILAKSPQAETARTYVAKRDIKTETLDAFMIGYSPDSWDSLIKVLAEKGITEEQLHRAGLVSKNERGAGSKSWYDRFRARLMFPICDHNGETVGFTARVMPGPDGKDPKDEAKYINTTQTLAYNKSHVLYGLHLAKHEIKKKNVAVIVEGNMDVVASHQAGVTNVVASSGTSFTGEQLQLLKRFTDRLVLSFDADAAGENAVRRSIDNAVTAGFSVRILRLPTGLKDPDDCIRKDPKLWEKAITDALPYMAWYLALARERTDMRDPDATRTASDTIIKEIAKITSPVERAFWTRETAQLFDTPESAIQEAVSHSSRPQPINLNPSQPLKKATIRTERLDRHALISQYILAGAITWPVVAEAVVSAVSPEDVADRYKALYTSFLLFYTAQVNGGQSLDFAQFLDSRDSSAGAGSAETAAMALLAEKEFGALDAAARRETFVRLIGELKLLQKARRQKELRSQMAIAERSGNLDDISTIAKELGEMNV